MTNFVKTVRIPRQIRTTIYREFVLSPLKVHILQLKRLKRHFRNIIQSKIGMERVFGKYILGYSIFVVLNNVSILKRNEILKTSIYSLFRCVFFLLFWFSNILALIVSDEG